MFWAIIVYKLCCVPAGVMHVGPYPTLKECQAWATDYDRTGQNWNFRSHTHCSRNY